MSPRARALGALLVALLALAQVHASADHWHLADDITNLRWALEHRDAPWRALTARHSVHDHVRPLTLLATWAGAMLGDGAWGAIRAVNVGLLLGGLLGAAALARRLAGDGAALLAALLLLSMPGFQDLPWWNAWICSAGELCCGLWALWAADRSLARGRAPLAGLLLLALAGLFKEPGWLYALPLAGLALRHRRPAWALAPLLVAAAGVSYTWHPANTLRATAVPGSLLSRVDAHLDQLTWPGEGPAQALAALPQDPAWPLRALLLWAPLVALATPPGRARWLCGLGLPALLLLGQALLGQALPGGPSLGWAPVLLVGLALARTWRAPSPGLLLLAASLLPVLPYPGTNAVQQLGGAAGLAIALATAARGRGLPLLAAGATLCALISAVTRPPPAMVADVEETRARRAAILGLAAASQALGATALEGEVDDLAAREALLLAPLWGVDALQHPPGEVPAARGGLQVGATLLRADPSPLLALDLLGGRALPVARQREDRPRPGQPRSSRVPADDPGLALAPAPGRYLLGVTARDGQADAGVHAGDACGHEWTPASPRPGAQATGVVLELLPGCGPLQVRRTLHAARQRGTPFLVPLPAPRLSFRRAPIPHPVVEVEIGPVKLDPALPGGPRPPGL